MPQTETWTIKRLLDWTAEFFARHEADSPRLEAEILLAEALGCQRIDLYTRFDEIPAEQPRTQFRDWVKRRANGVPVAYLVGHREFYSLRFAVNEHVLIPRPESEHLVVEAIELTRSFNDQQLRIADVGTGSGCLAVALAKHIDRASLIAIDISPEAIEVAQQNAQYHQVADRIELVTSDLFADLDEQHRFHIIVSNPPYIGRAEVDTIDPAVHKYEPEVALFADDDGLGIIRRLLQQSTGRLVAGGFLLFEISPFIVESAQQLIASMSELELVKCVKDLAGHPRVLIVQLVGGR